MLCSKKLVKGMFRWEYPLEKYYHNYNQFEAGYMTVAEDCYMMT